ncbi:MAG: hypothetical protein AVDCRST_MAG49-3964 [uncultured Thermomicrobiales bacterium]|uniref:Uncharacterized protein n=1 Tax=uncultured Thermomicrobiales bacterium TaxID=1645740 RepID=A0A6J4VHW2_9BACT|nr:MAG: hypothetical protein AVDCRST_MAG49-3964 [uncultured Thermomicrobiales bacterium]
MGQGGITFDFHDTLARCDRWFALETRELVAAFLGWQASERGEALDADVQDDARAAYRRLRLSIIADGREQDAASCVALVLAELGRPVDHEEIARALARLMRESFDGDVRPMPGAAATVAALAAEGIPLGIVSSAVYPPFLAWTLQRFGLDGHFGAVVTSADAGYYKTCPEIYDLAAERLGIDPALSVHVGDSHRFDVLGARRAGMRTVWVRGEQGDPDGGVRSDLVTPTLEGQAEPLMSLLARAS